MTRYWQRKDVEIVRDFPDSYPFAEPERWTEVRVVPLDSVVIDGPLPEVKPLTNGRYEIDGSTYMLNRAAEEYEEDAAESLRDHLRTKAAAAYLRSHPPVDPAQVKALADDLSDVQVADWIDISTVPIARRLIARGWTKGDDPR